MKTRFLMLVAMLTAQIGFALEASVSFATFKSSPRSYIELYVYITGKSVAQKQIDSIHSVSNVDMTIVFRQGDTVAAASKFRLNSPPSVDPVDFQDLRRFSLPDGAYELEITFSDVNNSADVRTFKAQVVLAFGGRATLQESDLVLMTNIETDTTNDKSQFAKNGLLMVPAPANYFDRNHKSLFFYHELYNADTVLKSDYLISYSIEPKYVDNPKPITGGQKRMKAQDLNISAYGLDISKLESGFYQFKLEIKSRSGETVKMRTVDFQRSNPFILVSIDTQLVSRSSAEGLKTEFVGEMDLKTLNYSLRALKPLMQGEEAELLAITITQDSFVAKQRFLFNHWFRKAPDAPERAHEAFMFYAKKVDENYKNGFGYGFETDRGYIFMKYGQPTDITSVEDEMNAPPYEIWTYQKIDATNQSNVKFIFYNPNLVVNGHKLLHSTCRAELQNPRWRETLYNSAQNQQRGNSADGRTIDKNFNRRAEQLFNDN
ncbi:MAG: hypothetical protein RL757_1408 [Bacteroidota bacterium]|jgi:GWxTD domain-containing protein